MTLILVYKRELQSGEDMIYMWMLNRLGHEEKNDAIGSNAMGIVIRNNRMLKIQRFRKYSVSVYFIGLN